MDSSILQVCYTIAETRHAMQGVTSRRGLEACDVSREGRRERYFTQALRDKALLTVSKAY